MSKGSSGVGSNTGAVVAGAAMALALALGAYLGFGRDTPQARNAEPAAQPATAPQEPVQTVQPAGTAPRFDELRRETDGTTIIAGRAAPLSDVTIIVDGEQVARTTTDSTGGFAAITTLPPKNVAQVVTLSSEISGFSVMSQDEIILAPTVSASVVPKPDPIQDVITMVQSDAPEQSAAERRAIADPDIARSDETTDTPVLSLEQPVPEQAPAPEPPRVAVLKSDAEGVSLLNPASGAMTAVALDTIGYSDLGEVQLTGRAQPDTAKVRVYLDNRSVISLPVGVDGRWRGDLPDVDEGVYILRVDEVSASGAVSSRVETPFKRESAEVLAQAGDNSEGLVKSITVQTGATLWAIARDRYGDGTLFVRVFEANADSIRNPDLIYPGQVFDLPN